MESCESIDDDVRNNVNLVTQMVERENGSVEHHHGVIQPKSLTPVAGISSIVRTMS